MFDAATAEGPPDRKRSEGRHGAQGGRFGKNVDLALKPCLNTDQPWLLLQNSAIHKSEVVSAKFNGFLSVPWKVHAGYTTMIQLI